MYGISVLQNSCMIYFFLLLFRHTTTTSEKHTQSSGLETEKCQHAMHCRLEFPVLNIDNVKLEQKGEQLVGRKCRYFTKLGKFFKGNTNLGGLRALGEPWYPLTGDRAP